ncbi:MAG TPA: hypothetical protein VFV23_08215 [Verrucomicrobiae bacterium]|nr:hypothetical protein [Verrucomicrobiae bacterium]
MGKSRSQPPRFLARENSLLEIISRSSWDLRVGEMSFSEIAVANFSFHRQIAQIKIYE